MMISVVRNQAVLKPSEQPFDSLSSQTEHAKHKFIVQSTYAPPDEDFTLDNV